jgi:hypothetical protein
MLLNEFLKSIPKLRLQATVAQQRRNGSFDSPLKGSAAQSEVSAQLEVKKPAPKW